MNYSLNKILRKYGKNIIILFLLSIPMYIFFVEKNYKNALKLMNADIEIERERLQNAINEFKNKEGNYPNLYGNENNLSSIKTLDGKYNFELFYGNEKIIEIEKNLFQNRKNSNKVNIIKDNSGGWFYDILSGKIEPNIN